MVVVVRQSPLAVAPHHVENGQVGRADQDAGEGSGLFTQRGEDVAGLADGPANHVTNGVAATLLQGRATIGGKAIDIEH